MATTNELKPDVKTPESGAMPEIVEKFAPGEAAPAEGVRSEFGFRNEFLPQKYQDILRNICQKIAERDMFARIDEVKRAAEQRFYWRSMFDMYFNEKNALWEMPGTAGWAAQGQDDGDVPLVYSFNIYLAFGRGFLTEVGVVPNVRFDAADTASPNALRIACAADSMRRHIESINDIKTIAKETARLFWTDGRVGFYTRWVTDGSRFGYYDDEDDTPEREVPEGLGAGSNPPPKSPRKPKGGEMITPFGALELKLPINMRRQCDFPFLQLSFEIDITSAKAMYPHISDTISGGTPGPGEYNFDRTTRIACTQGVRLLTQTGDTVHQLPTWQRTWIRPSMFSECEDENDRKFLEDNFPDGALVAFVGETYAESRNESMDRHWKIAYPIEGDGQTTPSCGSLVVPVQDCLNDLTDLFMESAMKGIPVVWMDKGMFDLSALSKQKAGPGSHLPTKRELTPNQKVADSIFVEPTSNIPAEIQQFYQSLFGDIPQFLTGLYPAALGSTDPSNETKGGILELRDASRGQQGPAWTAFQTAYAGALEQAVVIGAYFRMGEAEDGKIKLTTPGSKQVEIELEDLRPGSFYCVPDADQNIPASYGDQQRAFQSLWSAAAQGFQPAIDTVTEPKNLILAKKYLGIPGIVIPNEAETRAEMGEIEELIAAQPVPNVQAIQAFKIAAVAAILTKKPPPQPAPEQVLKPSIGIDEQVDTHQIRGQVDKDWLNSEEGQRIKRENPPAWLNVKLHMLLHQQAAQKQMQAMAQQKIQLEGATSLAKSAGKHPPNDPTESIAFKDLGPSGKIQLAARAGIDVRADEAADLAHETMTGVQPE